MPITINHDAPTLPTALVQDASGVDVPTLGHFLEEGFCSPALSRQAGKGRLVGRAVSLSLPAPPKTRVHHVTRFV
ncbi:MAG: RraA family protein, partial [Actinomycetia bacterium]|nr:RraA family protein [Actinomycetes bacterium]